jgi:5-(carboxyamino)imidazole ribonucleotide synthase
MILPGEKLGLLGGGQLGRMFTIAARTMGYDVVVLDPDHNSPAGALANEHMCAPYDDIESLNYLANTCSAVTTEFENVPASSLEHIMQKIPVRPGPDSIRIARNRILEKQAVRNIGLPTTNYYVIENDADLNQAIDKIQLPAILKTATLGYDGKGQVNIENSADLAPAYEELGRKPCVLEQRINLKCEVSVILARSDCGHVETYPIGENQHCNGILDITIVPGRVSDAVAVEAGKMARMLAEELNYIGVLAVEFFIDQDDHLMINEMAPRPHNSGHYTLDACLTDQFQQQVRTMCGFRPGDTTLTKPAVMVNILGDAWKNGEPHWGELLKAPGVFLHLYGKEEPRSGRKMGHYTCVGEKLEALLQQAKALKQNLPG